MNKLLDIANLLFDLSIAFVVMFGLLPCTLVLALVFAETLGVSLPLTANAFLSVISMLIWAAAFYALRITNLQALHERLGEWRAKTNEAVISTAATMAAAWRGIRAKSGLVLKIPNWCLGVMLVVGVSLWLCLLYLLLPSTSTPEKDAATELRNHSENPAAASIVKKRKNQKGRQSQKPKPRN